MSIIKSRPHEMQRFAESRARAASASRFVPTMGYLHEGHLSLMREGRRRASVLVASIFVNPTQFGPARTSRSYPRDFERDCAMMETVPVDVVFAPEAAAMYSPRRADLGRGRS